MKPTSIAKTALYLVVILVFNVLYFNIIENHTPARWVSYFGIHASYLLLCVSLLSYNRFNSGGSLTHVYPKALIAYGYFLTSTICGLLLIWINNSTITFPLIIHALIIGSYIFRYLLLMNAEAHTEANEQRNRKDALFIKDCVGKLELAMLQTSSREQQRIIERFRDSILGASMRTVPQAIELEAQIKLKIMNIEEILPNCDLEKLHNVVKVGLSLVREREHTIQLYKFQ